MKQVKALFPILTFLLLMSWQQKIKAEEFNLNSYLAATEEHPYDVSFWLQNASCTENFGWSRNSNDAAANYNTHNTEFDNDLYQGTCIESWYFAPVKNANLIWQEVKDLLPGTYVVTAYVVGQVYNDASNKGKCLPGLYLIANENRTPITANKWQKLSVTCTIKKGETLNIGITADATNANDWTGIAQVTLSCIAPGEADDIALSEDFDVTCVRGISFSNVLLKRNIPSDQLTTLCLPFDVSSELMNKYFSEVLTVSEVTPHGNDYIVSTTPSDDIKTGQVYLVKAKDESKSCYEFDNVLVNTTVPASQVLANGVQLQGCYRHTLTTQAVWQLQEDGKTLHRLNAPADQKGFGGNLKQ